MVTSSANESGSIPSKAAITRRVREILDDYLQRRSQGEAPSRADLERAHPSLMPTLAQELDLLQLMDTASRRARPDGASKPGATSAYRRRFADPAHVGGYSIKQEIHRGAQGVVYLATEDATGREAALKVLHPGIFGREGDSARFEREVGILRRLRHPGIVAVRDSGFAEGCHYFAMDYVEGAPLDLALRDSPRSLRDRVQLFGEIAEAVAAAHVRGVIHRDLKPANVRVDKHSRAHVLDFGLAKLVEGSESHSMTADGQFVGSLPWASPEQVGGGGDVDVRSDVYSLGVMLHQMLTGEFPYVVVGPVREVVRTIVEVEPQPASRTNAHIDHELDTIILKCLHKSPERRYQSAGELAADVRRYLAGEPIEAKRDSSLYFLRKHMARHRWFFALGGALLLSLAAFAVHADYRATESRILAQREAQARIDAEHATTLATAAQKEAALERDAARTARAEEESQRRTAEHQARRAEALTAFFVRTFGVADPDASETGGVTLLALIDRAAADVQTTFEGDPASEAKVRLVLGGAYATFGRLDEARAELERAVELHERVLMSSAHDRYEALWSYASVLEDSSPQDEWRRRWRMVWSLYPELLKQEAPKLAAQMRSITPEAFDAFEPALHEPILLGLSELAHAELAPDSPSWLYVADALHLAGARLGMKYKGETACRLLGDSLDIERRLLAETNRRVVRTVDVLITNELARAHFTRAAGLASAARASLAKTLPADHWLIAIHDAHLAVCNARDGRPLGAEETILAALARVEAARGADSPNAVKMAVQAANLYESLDRPEEAARWRRSVAERLVRSNDTDVIFRIHDACTTTQRPLADALMKLRAAHLSGAPDEDPLVKQVLSLSRTLVRDDEPVAALVSEFLYGIAKAEANRTRFSPQTLRLLDESARIAGASESMLPHKRGTAFWWLAYQHENSKNYAAAEPLARRALTHFETATYEHDRLVALGNSLLGACLSPLGRPDEAEPLLVAGYTGTLKSVGPASIDTTVTLRRLVRHYRALGKPELAIPLVKAAAVNDHGRIDNMLIMLDARSEKLAAHIRAVQSTPDRDRQKLSKAIAGLLAARRELLPTNDPYLPFFCDALYGLIDAAGRRADSFDLWRDASEELVTLETLAYGPLHRKTTFAQWWHTQILFSTGEFQACLDLAQRTHTLRLSTNWRDFANGRSRFEPIIAAATEALATPDQPLTDWPALFDSVIEVHGPSNVHAAEAFGHAVRSLAAQPDLAPDFARNYLSESLLASRDARHLARLAWKVAQHPGLPAPLYQLAAQLAARAVELRPSDADLKELLALAAWRSGDTPRALEAAAGDQPDALALFVRAAAANDQHALAQLRELIALDAYHSSAALRALLVEINDASAK